MNTKVEYYLPDSVTPRGSYGNCTVLWWKWALSIPRDYNPVSDRTGTNAARNQPGDVWFLAGIWADEDQNKKFPSRKCVVPKNASVLIPVLNCEADDIEYPDIKTDEDILNHVTNQVDKIVKKECFVNGKSIPPLRIKSNPTIFEVDIHPDFDKKHRGGHTRASSDGYWVFLKPLSKGKYEIRFEGLYEYGKLKSGAIYNILVE